MGAGRHKSRSGYIIILKHRFVLPPYPRVSINKSHVEAPRSGRRVMKRGGRCCTHFKGRDTDTLVSHSFLRLIQGQPCVPTLHEERNTATAPFPPASLPLRMRADNGGWHREREEQGAACSVQRKKHRRMKK